MTDHLPASPPSALAGGWRRFARNRTALGAAILLALIALICLAGPIVSPFPMDKVHWDRLDIAPDWTHWFGTDANGRDLFVRVCFGGQVSLLIALAAALIAGIIGTIYGAAAALLGGRADGVMMRIVDVFYALPFPVLVIVVITFIGQDVVLIFAAIGAVEWLDTARIVRAQTLSVKQQAFVNAAFTYGATRSMVLRHHILPNVLDLVAVHMTLTVPRVVILETAVSFLGLGIQEPLTSWGVLIASGLTEIETAPWAFGFPAGLLVASLFCLSFVGDGLRDALDPRGETRATRHRPSGRKAVPTRPGPRSMPSAEETEAAVLVLRDLTVRFETPTGALRAVDGVSFAVGRRECIGIVGESGCGKSQLFLSLLGVLAPNGTVSGSARFDGVELIDASRQRLDRLRGKRMTAIFQDSDGVLTPHLKIGRQMTEGLVHHHGLPRRVAEAAAIEMLTWLQIGDAALLLGLYPHQLAGGQRQRVAIATALLARPELLIADEPTSALDVTTQAQILDLLRERARSTAAATLIASHDLGVIAGLADRVLVMYAGRIVESAPTRRLLEAPRHPYTQGLLDCRPHVDAHAGRLPVIPGHPPDPGQLPRGCAFQDRCPHAHDRCHAEAPLLQEVAPGHASACFLSLSQ